MTLATIIETLKMIALKHPNVNSAYEGNIYEILNANPNNKYASVVITQQSHTTDEVYDHYGFVIFYVDRLVDDMEDNRVQIQSCGKSMLGNIITFFCEEFEAECDNITYQPFTQKFVDMTCGVYCTITIDTVKDVYCPEEYWKEDWVTPVTVIRNQDKKVTFTENGTYTIDYDPTVYTGLGNVEVNVDIDVDSYYNNGYNQGKTDGVNEQKSKLEAINITENGTYRKEDGYNEIIVNVPDLNGDYNEGYEQGHTDGYNEGYTEGEGIGYDQGQADVAAKARVLNVTENGNYLSKFSDPIKPTDVTGVYDDGREFYSYAYLEGISYDSGFIVSEDMEVEIWWKGDVSKTDKNLFGSQVNNFNAIFKIRIPDTAYRFEGEIAMRQVTYLNAESDRWYHFKISYADGLWVDGVKIGDFSANISGTPDKLYINSNTPYSFNGVNGYFGMIKITTNGVENIIIPTAEGLKNITTDEMLQVVQNGNYTFTENLPIYPKGELYKTINVNVIPKINPQKVGLRLGYSKFTEVPEWLDFNGITNMESMFRDCTNLRTIPLIDTSNVTTMSYMFGNCSNLQTIPLIDTSNVDDMYYMFSTCSNLQTIPLIDTSNVRSMERMFYGCSKLQTIPLLNTSNVTNMAYMFGNCGNLQTIPLIDTSNVTNMNHMFYDFSGIKTLVSLPKFNCQKVTDMGSYFSYYADGVSALTDVGGWENLKCNWNDRYGLASCPNLTKESCLNILNGLYDFTGNGETPNSSQAHLKVHANFLDKVGEEISIGTSRGWTITA